MIQFATHEIKSYFAWKTKKMSSAEFARGMLTVNSAVKILQAASENVDQFHSAR